MACSHGNNYLQVGSDVSESCPCLNHSANPTDARALSARPCQNLSSAIACPSKELFAEMIKIPFDETQSEKKLALEKTFKYHSNIILLWRETISHFETFTKPYCTLRQWRPGLHRTSNPTRRAAWRGSVALADEHVGGHERNCRAAPKSYWSELQRVKIVKPPPPVL